MLLDVFFSSSWISFWVDLGIHFIVGDLRILSFGRRWGRGRVVSMSSYALWGGEYSVRENVRCEDRGGGDSAVRGSKVEHALCDDPIHSEYLFLQALHLPPICLSISSLARCRFDLTKMTTYFSSSDCCPVVDAINRVFEA